MSLQRPRPAPRDGQGFDLAIVGGGATGLGLALDAAQRGLDVVLFESHDFGSGTSSRSTKLLHGGVRYLAQGQWGLVRQALHERSAVMAIAPHLAQPLRFVMPAYKRWQQPLHGAGLLLYDLLAGRQGLGRTRWLGPEATQEALPGVLKTGLRGGIAYWDGQFEDARLALSLARTAERAGAQVRNHTAFRRIDGAGHSPTRIEVEDRLSHAHYTVQARCVVNAAGVWVDRVRAQPDRPLVQPSQGVHLVVDRHFLGGDQALLVPRTQDGRVLFAVPWLGKLILGTTDTPRQDLPREPEALQEEREFILREARAVLARPVHEHDILSQWVGLRPLVSAEPGQALATRTLSREHTIVQDRDGLVTVVGGKWTTYRVMAADVLNHCMDAGLLPRRPATGQGRAPLLGAPTATLAHVPVHAAPGLHLYGLLADEVQACPGVTREIGLGLTEAMVRYAVRSEYACTVEDVLARRWRALFLDAREAARMAPDVAAILLEEGITEPGLAAFEALCRQYLPPSPSA